MKISSVVLALPLLCSFAYEVTSADCEQLSAEYLWPRYVLREHCPCIVCVILNIYALLYRALWDGTGVIHLQNCVSKPGIH